MKLTLLASFALAGEVAFALPDYTQFVDNFIGTQGPVPDQSYNGGNVFPGPALPFGSVKPGIDTTEYV